VVVGDKTENRRDRFNECSVCGTLGNCVVALQPMRRLRATRATTSADEHPLIGIV
jgi:hypothetical protein